MTVSIIDQPRRRRPILIDPDGMCDQMLDKGMTIDDVAAASGLNADDLQRHFYNAALPEEYIDAIREGAGIDVPIDLAREREQVAATEADLLRLRLDLDDFIQRLERSEEELRAASSAIRKAAQRRRGK